MAKGKNVYVVKHPQGWAVKTEGSNRPAKVTSTQREAVNTGRRIAQNQKSELSVQGMSGRFRSKDSFGNDPIPPSDREH